MKGWMPFMLGIEGENKFFSLLFNDFAVLALLGLVLLLVLASFAKLFVRRGKSNSRKATSSRSHRSGRRRRRRRQHRPSNLTLAETSGLPDKTENPDGAA